MPHPRINPAVKGDYVRISSYPGIDKGRKSLDMAGYIKLTDIKKAVRINDGRDGLQITLKSQVQPLTLRGPDLNAAEARLRKKGIGSI